MNFKEKYLKYKNKYLELQKQIGSGRTGIIILYTDDMNNFSKHYARFYSPSDDNVLSDYKLIKSLKAIYFDQGDQNGNKIFNDSCNIFKDNIKLKKYYEIWNILNKEDGINGWATEITMYDTDSINIFEYKTMNDKNNDNKNNDDTNNDDKNNYDIYKDEIDETDEID